jgi:hypothetical protein
VIEGGAAPVGGVMALLAGLREVRLHVIGIGRALEVCEVATDTSRIRAGQVVVAVHVALRAGDRRVGSGQGEAGGRVIKSRAAPVRGVVALLAGLREIRRHVIRIGRSLEIFQVAADTSRRRQVVVVVHVTLRALHRSVGASQREPGVVVIKRRLRP